MKLLPLSVLILIFGCISTPAQSDKQIAAIRAEVAAIEKAASAYEKKTRSIEGVSTEGAEATFYHSGKGLKKIAARVYGETFRATVEFYYSGDELSFAYQKISRYNGSVGTSTAPKVARVEETRLYRSGGRTIRILSGKTALKPGDIAFTEKEYELIEFSDQLRGGPR